MRTNLALFLFVALITLIPLAAGAAPDERLETLVTDLRALARLAELSDDLQKNRQVMTAIVDDDIEAMREPRGDGTYRWASLQREEGGRVSDEKGLERVYSEPAIHTVSLSAPRAYRLEISAPRKRNLVSANNRIYVKRALVDLTGFDGRVTRMELPVDVWVSPGDTHGIALSEIAKEARVSVDLGVESGTKKGVAQVSLLQAKLVDDPQSPSYPAVKRLLSIRETIRRETIDRGQLKSLVDEALLSMPGEMESRTAAQAAEAAERSRMAERGISKGSIELGDATPDVVHALDEILRLLAGTAEEQAEGRAQLQNLTQTLRPTPKTE